MSASLTLSLPCPALPRLQIQSNALAALEALDMGVAERVFEEGCITGDRINGLCDGATGDWCVLLCICVFLWQLYARQPPAMWQLASSCY